MDGLLQALVVAALDLLAQCPLAAGGAGVGEQEPALAGEGEREHDEGECPHVHDARARDDGEVERGHRHGEDRHVGSSTRPSTQRSRIGVGPVEGGGARAVADDAPGGEGEDAGRHAPAQGAVSKASPSRKPGITTTRTGRARRTTAAK